MALCRERALHANMNVYQLSHPRIAVLDSRVAAQEPYLLDEASGKSLVALRQEQAQASTRRKRSITPDTRVRSARCWTNNTSK